MASRGWDGVSLADVRRRNLQKGVRKPKAARSKYGAVKTEVDGIVFHSAKEAARYLELKLLERAGEIRHIVCQPSFPLRAGPAAEIGKYVADFAYRVNDGDEMVVEDVKGFDTPLSRWKRRHTEAQYGITVRVI